MTVTLAPGARLVVATHNAGKLAEIRDLLAPHAVEAVSAGELGLSEPEETGATYEANALLKAEAAATRSGEVALADDSGLSVDALDGAPGVHSARWAGDGRDFAMAMEKLERALQAAGATAPAQRTARFIAVLCLAEPGGGHEFFRGEVTGRIVWPPRGEGGFGYDPVFLPDGRNETFGEMGKGLKQAISHRARALAALVEAKFTVR